MGGLNRFRAFSCRILSFPFFFFPQKARKKRVLSPLLTGLFSLYAREGGWATRPRPFSLLSSPEPGPKAGLRAPPCLLFCFLCPHLLCSVLYLTAVLPFFFFLDGERDQRREVVWVRPSGPGFSSWCSPRAKRTSFFYLWVSCWPRTPVSGSSLPSPARPESSPFCFDRLAALDGSIYFLLLRFSLLLSSSLLLVVRITSSGLPAWRRIVESLLFPGSILFSQSRRDRSGYSRMGSGTILFLFFPPPASLLGRGDDLACRPVKTYPPFYFCENRESEFFFPPLFLGRLGPAHDSLQGSMTTGGHSRLIESDRKPSPPFFFFCSCGLRRDTVSRL